MGSESLKNLDTNSVGCIYREKNPTYKVGMLIFKDEDGSFLRQQDVWM